VTRKGRLYRLGRVSSPEAASGGQDGPQGGSGGSRMVAGSIKAATRARAAPRKRASAVGDSGIASWRQLKSRSLLQLTASSRDRTFRVTCPRARKRKVSHARPAFGFGYAGEGWVSGARFSFRVQPHCQGQIQHRTRPESACESPDNPRRAVSWLRSRG
jgi:hypothetical protein